jgi:hypothetical protein
MRAMRLMSTADIGMLTRTADARIIGWVKATPSTVPVSSLLRYTGSCVLSTSQYR